jgi:hypothetical protein
MSSTFTGWPTDGPAFLAEIAKDNTREFWDANHERHERSVLGPARALAAELEPEFGPLRVFRSLVNRRFRPDAPLYRTDTGAVATSWGGSQLAVVLSATSLTASAGHWLFDPGQLRRFRAAVDGEPGGELEAVLADLPGLTLDQTRRLAGRPRRCPATHPRIELLRHRGLLVTKAWPVGEWLATAEPLHRVREAWRAAGPLVRWLDTHVGEAEPVAPRPRVAPATTAVP